MSDQTPAHRPLEAIVDSICFTFVDGVRGDAPLQLVPVAMVAGACTSPRRPETIIVQGVCGNQNSP